MRKPYFNLVVVIALLLGLLATVPTKVALADCTGATGGADDILCSGDDTDGVDTGGGGSNADPDVVTVEAGTTVSNSGDAVESDDELSVVNDGIILGDGGDGVDAGDDVITFTNTGTISATWQGVDIRYDIEETFNNSGTIISENSDAVRVGDDLDGDLTNSYVISGAGEGISIGNDIEGSLSNSGWILGYWDGLDIGDDLDGDITNSGVIFGENGQGIDIDEDMRYNSAITNTGWIEGDSAGISIGEDMRYSSSIDNAGYIYGYDGDGIYIGDDMRYGSSITNAGEIVGFDGAGIFIDDDLRYGSTIDNSGYIGGYYDGIYINESADGTIINNGEIEGYLLHGIEVYDDDYEGGGQLTIINNGVLVGGAAAVNSYGQSVITNTGYIGSLNDYGYATLDLYHYDDYVYTSGTIDAAGGGNAMNLYDGDDTVIIAGAGATYSTACGDHNVTSLHGPIVNGLMDGGDYKDYDSLTFSILTTGAGDASAFDPSGGSAANGAGGTYDWTNFEELTINFVVFSEGATRLFDDGVVLAFANGGKIDVCSGEKGFRAGTVDMGALDNGQRTFSAGNEGWFVVVTDLGGGQFEAHIFDGAGVEHFNDADGNGVADSTFVFSR